MEGLKPYEAVHGLTLRQYIALLRVAGQSSDEIAKDAVERGGMFWSAKYRCLYAGKWSGQIVTPHKEYRAKLINEIDGKENTKD